MKLSKPKFMGLLLAMMVTLIDVQAGIFVLLALIFMMGIGFEVKE